MTLIEIRAGTVYQLRRRQAQLVQYCKEELKD